jgi:glycosyltransferase involved in cell wall biosynthesis
MSTETVTIVIPTYKRPQKLRRAIQSVLDQTYKDLKILVFDNASSDETAAVVSEIKSTDPRVEYFCHERNIGMLKNLNYAFSQVSTPFFGILTDDDCYLPTFIDDAMRAFKLSPTSQLSILSAPMVTEDGILLSDQLAAWPKEGAYAAGESIMTAASGSHPVITMCIFRLSLKDQIRFDPAFDSMADVPVLISILEKYPFHLSKKRGGFFFKHANSYGATFARLTNAKAICDVYLRIERYFHDSVSIDSKTRSIINLELKRRIDKVIFFLLLENITLNNFEAVKYLQRIISGRSLSPWLLPAVFLSAASKFGNATVLSNSIRISRKLLRTLRGAKRTR